MGGGGGHFLRAHIDSVFIHYCTDGDDEGEQYNGDEQ